MTHIEQMIQDLCPNGVEFKTLGEVCEIRGRIGFRGYTRQDQVSKGEGAISLSPANIKGSKISYDDSTYITWEKYKESPEIMVDNGDVIFCKTASVGKTAYIDELPEKATINPQLVLLKNIKCNSKFLSYYLQTPRIQDVVKQMQGVGSVPNVSQAMLSKLAIPLPPIEIQKKIVECLDKFCKRSCKRSCKCVVSSMSTIVPNYLRHTRIAILLTIPMIAIGNGKHWERYSNFEVDILRRRTNPNSGRKVQFLGLGWKIFAKMVAY